MRFRMLRATALAFTVALLAASCAAEDAQPAPSASASPGSAAPTVKELFGSQEAAEEAALEALSAYWAASAEVYSAPENGVGLLEPLVTEQRLEDERELVEAFVRQEFVQVGQITVEAPTFQQLYAAGSSIFLVVTTCTDYSNHGAVNPAGETAARTQVQGRVIAEATFQVTEAGTGFGLILDRAKPLADMPC